MHQSKPVESGCQLYHSVLFILPSSPPPPFNIAFTVPLLAAVKSFVESVMATRLIVVITGDKDPRSVSSHIFILIHSDAHYHSAYGLAGEMLIR
jgi:hypothetical protein